MIGDYASHVFESYSKKEVLEFRDFIKPDIWELKARRSLDDLNKIYILEYSFLDIDGAVKAWKRYEQYKKDTEESVIKTKTTIDKEKKHYPWFEDLDNIFVCPGCQNRVDNIYTDDGLEDDPDQFDPEYCPYCGMHLDWTRTVSYGVKEEHE